MMRRMVRGAAALAVAVLASTGSVAVAPVPAGADGPGGFAVGGWVPLPLHTTSSLAVEVVDDGAILAVYVAPGPKIEVRRFLADGRLDAAYGTGGVMWFPTTSSALWQPPVITADGAAYVTDTAGDQAQTHRVTPAGALDGSYGTGGVVLGATVAPDGTARRTRVIEGVWRVERFDAHGQPDGAFAGDGTAELAACPLPASGGNAVAFGYPDGTSLAGCFEGVYFSSQTIVRLDPTGTQVGAAGPSSRLPSLSGSYQLDDGTLLSVSNTVDAAMVTRWNTDLTVDTTFGDAGTVWIPGLPRSVAVDGDRIFVTTMPGGPVDGRDTVRVAALDDDGLDAAFGADGVVEVQALWPDPDVVDGASMQVVGDGSGGAVLAATMPSGAAWDARLRQVDATGRIRSEVRVPPTLGPLLFTDDGAVILGSRQPATLGERPNALRRFDLEDLAVAPHASATAFAKRLSLDVRGRAATADEVVVFTTAITGGIPASTLVRRAIAEPAWTSKLEPSVRLYWAYFGRPPDPSGLRYWMGKRASGMTVARMSAVFADSSEFKRTYGSLTSKQFVELVYRNVMGRDGDAGGVAYWTGRLDRRVTSRGQLMATFSESSEHVRRRAAEVAVVSPFVALLGRTPTAAELAAWTGASPRGDTEALVRDLLASAAYGARVS